MLQKCQVGLEWRRGSFLKIRTEHFITFKIIQLTCEQCRSWDAHNPLSSSAENPHMICSCPPYTWLLCIHGSISSTSCSVVFTTEKNVHKTGLVQLLDPVVQESTVMAKQSTASGNLALSDHLFQLPPSVMLKFERGSNQPPNTGLLQCAERHGENFSTSQHSQN